MESSTYPDKKFVQVSQSYVNVAIHSGTGHGTKEIVVGREKKTVCKVYGNLNAPITCQDHEAARSKSFPGADKVRGVPAIIILDPTGEKNLYQSAGGKSASQLVKVFQDVLKENRLQPIPYALYKKGLAKKAKADGYLESKDYRKAIGEFRSLARLPGPKSLKEWGKKLSEEGLAKANEAGLELLKEAEEKSAGDDAQKKAAKKIAARIARDFNYTEAGKKAKELLRNLK